MPSEDIIRIDGVEYEQLDCPCPTSCQNGSICMNIRPKRKQTGWICTCCQSRSGGCVVYIPEQGHSAPVDCRYGWGCKWRPFYGKVVE